MGSTLKKNKRKKEKDEKTFSVFHFAVSLHLHILHLVKKKKNNSNNQTSLLQFALNRFLDRLTSRKRRSRNPRCQFVQLQAYLRAPNESKRAPYKVI